MTTETCPCGRDAAYENCCKPLLARKTPARTAEDLLRARYAAFVKHDVDYILDTHHSRTRGEMKREEVEEWAKSSKWLGLNVVQKEAGEVSDDQGTIVFCATYEDKDGKRQEHWEQSYFEKEGGEWKFLDAKGVHLGTYRRETPKTGRNDACPCGSGKKFKKCCAA